MAHWGYGKDDGPRTWKKVAPIADGKRQSPIDIVTDNTKKDDTLACKPFKYSYVPANSKTIINNGHSAQVVVDSAGSSLTGGPLKHKYELAQWHLHWGKTDATGSEHRVDGEMYSAELHLVHWNTELFKDVGEAAASDQGLCVLGFFLKGGKKEHEGLKAMTDVLGKIPYPDDKFELTGGMDPSRFITVDTSKYWTYLGSLTTPPLYESVTWVVFKDPIEVSECQMNAFRSLNTVKKGEKPQNELGEKIIENYRPPQPLFDRVVSSSF